MLQSLTNTRLTTLHEEFDNADRPWVFEISNNTRDWFGTQKFVKRCLDGEVEAILGVILEFWPFVGQLPDQIIRVGHKIGWEEIKGRFRRKDYGGFGGSLRLIINLMEFSSFKKMS